MGNVSSKRLKPESDRNPWRGRPRYWISRVWWQLVWSTHTSSSRIRFLSCQDRRSA